MGEGESLDEVSERDGEGERDREEESDFERRGEEDRDGERSPRDHDSWSNGKGRSVLHGAARCRATTTTRTRTTTVGRTLLETEEAPL